jgi:hypothetical protein
LGKLRLFSSILYCASVIHAADANRAQTKREQVAEYTEALGRNVTEHPLNVKYFESDLGKRSGRRKKRDKSVHIPWVQSVMLTNLAA